MHAPPPDAECLGGLGNYVESIRAVVWLHLDESYREALRQGSLTLGEPPSPPLAAQSEDRLAGGSLRRHE